MCQFNVERARPRGTVLPYLRDMKGRRYSLTQAEHKSRVAQPPRADPRGSDVGLRVGARDLRSRIDPGLEIEDINQRSAALVHVGGRY